MTIAVLDSMSNPTISKIHRELHHDGVNLGRVKV